MADWSLYDRGFSLFPLIANSKTPALDWAPYQTARAAPDLIALWASRSHNIGIATGAVSGVIVLDCDNVLARAEAERRGLPRTFIATTPRGSHIYLQHPGWTVSNRAGRGWTIDPADPSGQGVDGWDLRGDGGYVVGPGSYYIPSDIDRAKGKIEGGYGIECDAPIAPAPDWLLALILPRARKPMAAPKVADETSDYGRAALNAEITRLIGTPPGTINNQINLSSFAIGQLVAGGEITTDEALGALQEALAVLGVLDDGKAPGTMERGFAAGMDNPRSAEPMTPEAMLGVRTAVAPPPPPVDGMPVAASPSEPTTALVRGQTIWHEQMDPLFAGCYFVERQESIFVRGRGLLKSTAFDTLFGGFQYPLTVDSARMTRSAWEAFRTSPTWKCPIVHDICFRPDRAPGTTLEIEGRPFINTYEPIQTKRIKGDPGRFIAFLRKLLPDDRDFDILVSYLCALVQNPGRKFQYWPVLQGIKGNGKTLVLTVLQHAVGKRYTHLVNPEAMGKTGNQFNSWVQGNLLVGVEEIFVSDQRHILETFKPLVTNVRTAIESKGKDQTTGDNYANGIMLTNHKDGVPISDDERRYAILWTAQQTVDDLARDGMEGAYFPDLYDWLHGRGDYAGLGEDYGLSVVNDWLRSTEPVAEFNPAGLCQRAPQTSSTDEAIRESLGTLEQEVLEAIECGLLGFRNGVVSSLAMRSLFDRLRRPIAPKLYKRVMASLGYHTHPMLAHSRGRLNNPLADGTRPVFYFPKYSPFFEIVNLSELKAAIENAMEKGNMLGDNVVKLPSRQNRS